MTNQTTYNTLSNIILMSIQLKQKSIYFLKKYLRGIKSIYFYEFRSVSPVAFIGCPMCLWGVGEYLILESVLYFVYSVVVCRMFFAFITYEQSIYFPSKYIGYINI